MKKRIALAAALGVLAASPAFASGYRIPEQSINSTALANASVAYTPNADASYYNPANMSWLDKAAQAEASLTWIQLTSIDYTDSAVASRNGSSKDEDFVLPNLHLVSPYYGNNWRFGLSVIYPYGLSKQWPSGFARTSAEEFTLRTYEINPTVSYKVNDKFSLGGGVRVIYSEGKVKSNGSVPATSVGGSTVYSTIARDMDGDTTEYGYNLAATFRPVENLSFAATYRSKVDLDIDGDAVLSASQGFLATGTPVPALAAAAYSGGASVSVPAPAVLSLAVSYTCNNGKTTAEFAYDQTYWDAYEQLDFNYASALSNPVLIAAFDNAKPKNWDNSDAFRIGLSHKLTDQWTIMAGFAIDRNPVPDRTLGFELPDSDAKIYSCGVRYQATPNLNLGAAYLFDDKESRTVSTNLNSVNGTFEDAGAHLLTAGLQYRF
ncbi:MAG: OmpP1/FadL family transporter [Thermodesulfobacteriota bacterium]